jgi:metal-responsive CopG/Arc/MetJ family transcriptional regulator
MPRIYTEIRIAHESLEIKEAYEKKLDEMIRKLGYKSRAEWLNGMYRESARRIRKEGI